MNLEGISTFGCQPFQVELLVPMSKQAGRCRSVCCADFRKLKEEWAQLDSEEKGLPLKDILKLLAKLDLKFKDKQVKTKFKVRIIIIIA